MGDNNIKNGPDRIVDGVMIQSKYYQTGKGCINACFDNEGNFRYITGDGSPMKIEVPSDKYQPALEAMEQKIRDGQIKGVSDYKEAKNIVLKGKYTYQQAKNIAKAGNIDSIKYDAKSGAVTATSAFGITTIITFAINMWSGKSVKSSIKIATYSGLKVGGVAFVTNVVSSQLSKAGLNSTLVGSSEAIVGLMGPKAAQVIVNSFRTTGNIYGAAAMKSAAKLLRSNIIVSTVSVVVLSSVDVANVFRGKISSKQLFKNIASTTGAVAGGAGGWIAGAAAGSTILPGPGSIIGGVVGSVVAGTVAGKATEVVTDIFVQSDADQMVQIIQEKLELLSSRYLLNKKELESVVDNLSKKISGNTLMEMFRNKNRSKFSYDLIYPLIQEEVSKRESIETIDEDKVTETLKEILEEISDEIDKIKKGNNMNKILLSRIKKFTKVEEDKIIEKKININDMSFLILRDNLIHLGKILEEDFTENIYIVNISAGFANGNTATVGIKYTEDNLLLISYAKEGLINQNISHKAIKKVEKKIENYVIKK